MRRLPGIIEAKASYREGKVVVKYDPAAVSPAQMADAITNATYYTVGKPVSGGELKGTEKAAQGATAVILVEGMTDDKATSLVTQTMGAVGPGVGEVSLNVPGSTLKVVFDPQRISAQTLADAINRGTGYQASVLSSGEPGGGTDYTPYILFGISAMFAAALAWTAVAWSRRRLAGAHSPESRAARRRGQRGR